MLEGAATFHAETAGIAECKPDSENLAIIRVDNLTNRATIPPFHPDSTKGDNPMRFFVEKFKWVMLISGLLTCTMFLGLFSPRMQLENNFGQTLTGPVAEVLVRNWSALIGMIGVMLIYGAFRPAVRKFVLVIASVCKIIFITLILIYGREFLSHGLGTAVVADAVMILLYAGYLILDRGTDVP